MTTTGKKASEVQDILSMTTDIVAAYLSNNTIAADELPVMIKSIHGTLSNLTPTETEQLVTAKPAVPVKKSITDEYLVCLEDGQKLKMLKRYLRSKYNMTPEEYRKKWGLAPDYPMVAPNYSKERSAYARQFGLGKSKK